MPSATIRPFHDNDIVAATELWHTQPGIGLSSADEPAQLVAFLQRNPTTNFVAEREGLLVGTVMAGHDGRRGYLYHLAVAGAYQRQGVARRLVGAALDALREAGIVKCHAHVFADNDSGRQFWQLIGATSRVDLAVYSLATDVQPSNASRTSAHR